ncbi:hypothetical protein [Nocardia cerradoensis]|uniref:EthD domain-containing protein n=1 Tax=Nocardia cerradoensis TaxID=85688 RepID=A0A231HDN4_9NOCA|nr:hypothetical protein [Nocardia cerradoensis]NKY45734.1 serine kinase [Nocardia cerradoensis]OXR47031.1 hypothetical protein B7C42_00150 [Nocardia cerradoensis]
MIKRLRFATRSPQLSFDAFARQWPLLCAAAADAPSGLRPVRVAVCTVLPELTGPGPRHDGVVAEWFRDIRHLRRHDRWRSGSDDAADVVTLPDSTAEVIAREHVLRGGEWLERRWDDGGDRLKHMAVAVRAASLTAEEFATRWRAHAGTVRRPGAATVAIPDAARGRAYVQNHPVAATRTAYDAVNEVYFDDVTGLRTRIDWFRDNGPSGPDGLFDRSWFLAAREVVLSG